MSKSLEILNSKILDKERLLVKLTDWKEENKKIVFTNGCFDLIHLGFENKKYLLLLLQLKK